MSKKTYYKALTGLLILATTAVFSQNVGINTSGTAPNSSALLDMNTGNTFTSPNGKGLLIPNVSLTSTTDATTVTGPSTSLLVYNTNAAMTGGYIGYWYWNGAKWVSLLDNTVPGAGWTVVGNAGTTAGTNFLGTTDATDMVFKTNSTEWMRIQNGTGYIGIDQASPGAKLSFNNLNDGTNGADGITWYSPAATSYGIFRTAGAWSAPNYEQLTLAWQTGIVIDGGSLYGLSGTVMQPNGGNVGIGGYPAYRLQVDATGDVPYIDMNTTSAANKRVRLQYSQSGTINWEIGTDVGVNNTDNLYFFDRLTSTFGPVILDNGNVGIATSTPAYKLETDGDIYANGGWFRVSGNQGLYWQSWGPGWYCSDATWLRTYNNASIWANTGQIGTNGGFTCGYGGTIAPSGGAIFSGDVGIGLNNPSWPLHVYTASLPANSAAIWSDNETNQGASIYALNGNSGNGYDGAVKAVCTYSSNVNFAGGVVGYLLANGTGYGTAGITNSSNNGAYGLYAQGGGTYSFYCNGAGYFSGGYFKPSDRKVKTNIEPLQGSLAKLMQLNGYTYEYKPELADKYGFNKGQNIGVIADEVEKVFPQLIKETQLTAKITAKGTGPSLNANADTMSIKSVNYTDLIPVLIEAIKEQQKLIVELQQKVQALEAKK